MTTTTPAELAAEIATLAAQRHTTPEDIIDQLTNNADLTPAELNALTAALYLLKE